MVDDAHLDAFRDDATVASDPQGSTYPFAFFRPQIRTLAGMHALSQPKSLSPDASEPTVRL
jgi:hypothetical protein